MPGICRWRFARHGRHIRALHCCLRGNIRIARNATLAAADGPVTETASWDPGPDSRLDVSVAHIARVYNYWLGGKDHFAADRAAGEATIGVYPGIQDSARANRAFLARAVRYLAETEGIRQFLDIGTGLPTANNTHEVAQ